MYKYIGALLIFFILVGLALAQGLDLGLGLQNGGPLTFTSGGGGGGGNCILISGTTSNCLLISGTTTNSLLVK